MKLQLATQTAVVSILNRIKMYGDNIQNHNLNHLLIINNKIVIRN